MPRLTGPTSEGIAALMPYFNSLLGAVEQRASTSDLWAAYRHAVEVAGGVLGNPSIFDMNYMAGYARGLANAEANLSAAPGENAIDSTMWGWAPWAAGETDAWLADRFQVRYEAQVSHPELGQQTIWGVTDWEGSLEGVTKDQMLARALASAQESIDSGSPRVQAQLGMEQGFSLDGISRVQIMRL